MKPKDHRGAVDKRVRGSIRRRVASLGSFLKGVGSSLTARCLTVAGLYAAFVALSVMTVAGLSDAHISNAFVSDAELDEVKQTVLNDDYSVLAEKRFAGMEVLVLDESGKTLYSSSSMFSQAISKDDIAFINEEEWDARFSVFEERVDGETMYRVLWLGGHDNTGFETIMGYALIDHDLNIVEGTIFGDRTSITPEQFGLLNGVIEFPNVSTAAVDDSSGDDYPFNMILREGQYVISRTRGVNDEGETRIIVKAVPVINSADYDRVFAESQGIMLALVPVIAVSTIVLFVVETRLIRSSTRPLVRAIEEYSATHRVEAEPEKIASELIPVYDGFVDLTQRLEGAQAEKQRMIADISHDIKTPLTAIRGYAQAFRDGVVPPDRTAAYAQALCAKAEVATSMVEALGEYAAAEHPEYRCELERTDLACDLERICAGLEPIADQYGDGFEARIETGPIEVEVDIELVRRAITNLVSNACVHNAPGTRVGVIGFCDTDDEGRPVVRVQVADTGSGIDPGLVSTLFEPFVTSNAARSIGKGSGLGLSIARRFVELNGGSLRLLEEAPEPWSTCFEIVLPRL